MGDAFDPTTTCSSTSRCASATRQGIDALVQKYTSAIAMVLDAFKDLGFKYATQAGITISKNDVIPPAARSWEVEGRSPRSRASTTWA
jgi:DNA-directed RNA polymerase subunit beta'